MPTALTLLLTDVIDSTDRNSRIGDPAMAAIWAEHDRRARTLMQRWQALEIGRSDGFLLLFEEVGDALGFAHDYLRALAGLAIDLRARVGVHTGPVELRRNSAADVSRGAPLYEVDGLALPLAARLMAAAGGGQTLLSSDSRRLVEPKMVGESIEIDPRDAGCGAVPGGVDTAVHPAQADVGRSVGSIRLRLVSHGHWRLKGIDGPVHVFQAGADEDDFTPPSDSAKAYRVVHDGTDWLPAGRVPNNLPAERDLFVGRAGVLDRLARRFDEGARLVSLLGIGGIGKTRLALRYARRWLGDYAGGAWFCDLSAARSLDGIVYAAAQALEVPLDKTDPVESLGAAISGRGPCLVILDNFEQVARHAEATLGAWMFRAPQACFIATSRELLGITGEHALQLEPLASAEAQELLRHRMAAAGIGTLAGADEAALEPLVELLDRLPLAIELAAARGRVMRPAELLVRMGERFKLLASRGGRHDRQATLRAALDWSWDLLSQTERAALCQCSVFEGGFTLAAAEAVLDLSSLGGETWVTDVVQSLVDKSLLRQSPIYRFDMLRSVHDYAAERLTVSGAALRHRALARHWQWFGSLSEKAAIADSCIEAENLVVACERATDAGEIEAASNALLTAWAALNLTGPFNVAIQMAQALHRVAHPHSMQVAMTALWVSGSARYLAGDVTAARGDLEEATWAGGSLALRARALGALGQLERSVGHLGRADELLGAGLIAAQQTGESGLICRAYNALGTLRLAQAQLEAAHDLFTTGLEAARLADDLKQQAALLGNIGVVERKRGRDEPALRHYREALELAQRIGDRRFEGNMRSNIGLFHVINGDCETALGELQAALEIAQGAGLTRLAANVLCSLGLAEEALGDVEGALARHREGERLADRLADAYLGAYFKVYLGRLLARSGSQRQAEVLLEEAEGLLAKSPDRGLAGLLACARAELDIADGLTGRAEDFYRTALARMHESASGENSELAKEIRRVRSALNSR